MPTDTLQSYTVSQAAAIVAVSPSTVRSWCNQFGAHLSASATPTAGNERLLTPGDVAILQRVAELREQNQSYSDIAQQLDDLDSTDLQPYVAVEATTPAPRPTEKATDPTTGLSLAVGLLQAIDNRTAPLQAQIEAINTGQSSRFTWFVAGFLCGLATALIAILAFALGVSR